MREDEVADIVEIGTLSTQIIAGFLGLLLIIAGFRKRGISGALGVALGIGLLLAILYFRMLF